MVDSAAATSRVVPRILVATDLSEPADEALRQGHDWAAAVKGELVVCHVIPSSPQANLLFPQRNEPDAFNLIELERQAGELVSDRVTEITGRDPEEFRLAIDSGVPETVIVAEAEETAADVVVIGNRGASGGRRMPLGSVAERVLRFAHCSVLVARSHPQTGRVLAATDLSDPLLPAVRAGVDAAERRGAKLTILHNVDSSPMFVPPLEVATGNPMSLGTMPQAIPVTLPPPEQIRDAGLQHLRDFVSQRGMRGDCLVTDGEPALSILRVAEEQNAELVVVGTHSRTGLIRVALGSTAEKVVRTMPCTVLVVRLSPDSG